MTVTTKLEPISRERATRLLHMLEEASSDERKAISLDDAGFAEGVVDVDDPSAMHLLGDLDVHA